MRTLAAISMALLFTACAGSSELTGDRRNVGVVTVTFTARPGRVDVGKSVLLTLRLVNNSGNEEKLTFPTSQQYDFWVTKRGKEVWRWSEDTLFAQSLTEHVLGPQSSLVLDESWTATAAGTYVVHGDVFADGYRHDMQGTLIVGG
jgi:hypothetical protein